MEVIIWEEKMNKKSSLVSSFSFSPKTYQLKISDNGIFSILCRSTTTLATLNLAVILVSSLIWVVYKGFQNELPTQRKKNAQIMSRILPYLDRLLPYIDIWRLYTGIYGVIFRRLVGRSNKPKTSGERGKERDWIDRPIFRLIV